MENHPVKTLDILRRDVRQIVVILPCCIGDVVLGTALLPLLRRQFPDASITWAINTHSKGVLEAHPLIDELLETGESALPLNTWREIWGFAKTLRGGRFDLAISLVRSPKMTLAVFLSGIRHTAGINSNGRGVLYRYRFFVNPDHAQHEMAVYLGVLGAMGVPIPEDALPPSPLRPQDSEVIFRDDVRSFLADVVPHGAPYIVVNPNGGNNPGMNLPAKRYPLAWMAEVLRALSQHTGGIPYIVLGGKGDADTVNALIGHLKGGKSACLPLVEVLGFTEMASLMHHATLYIGNDTGLTHYAASTGIKTVMLLGPTDPRRYAPKGTQATALYRTSTWATRGVADGIPQGWTWEQDGIPPHEALARIKTILG